MRDVTTSDHHASDADMGTDDHVDLTTDAAEQTPGADDGTAAPTGTGWLPRMTVQAATGGPRWGMWTTVLGAVALLVAAGVVLATRLPGGTTLAGAPIASAADAPAALAAADQSLAALDITFTTAAGGRVTTTGADLGLDVDHEMSQAPVADGLPALGAWVRRLPQGPLDVPFVVTTPTPEVLAGMAADVSTDPVNADVQVRRAGVDITPGADGLQTGPGQVDAALDRALAAITTQPPSAWPGTLEVDVSGDPVPPAVTQADIDEITAVIDTVEEADVSLTAQVRPPPGQQEAEEEAQQDDAAGDPVMDVSIDLEGTELRSLVAVEAVPDAPAGQRLRLVPDTAAPPPRVVALLDSARIPPVLTATVENRSPTPGPDDDLTDVTAITGDVVPGQTLAPGFEPDREATLAAIIDAALAGGGSVEVIGGPDPTPDPAAMGIAEPVATFTSFFPAGESRVQNIHRIADIVDGTIIPAGESYELNHAVGRRTRENGFTLGGAILDGELVADVGGGVSQFATAFFNAAWFSGVDLVDWKAHSFYFARYPPGREATINYPNVNLEIRNDTPYAILIDTDHTPSSVTVTFWSTPYWDVETIMGPCGCGGSFSITNQRIRTAPGGDPVEESWTTTYTVPQPE